MRKMADATMLIKYIVKNLAHNQERPPPYAQTAVWQAGSGMHVHMHLLRMGSLSSRSYGYSGLSETAQYRWITQHAPALCGFTNPSTNSYKRLVPGYEARSRSVMPPPTAVPSFDSAYAKTPSDKRFEIRSPMPLVIRILLFRDSTAGLDGIKRKLDPAKLGMTV